MTNNNLTKFKKKKLDEFFDWFIEYDYEHGSMDWEKADKKLNKIINDTVDMTIEAVRLEEKNENPRDLYGVAKYNQAVKHQQAKIKKLKGEK